MFVETAVVATLVCASTKRSRADAELHLISGRTQCVQVASGRTLETVMTEEINDVSGVADVKIRRDGSVVSVDVEMSQFDRNSRRSVYAAERRLAKRYPNHRLDVRLIDRSPEHQSKDADEGTAS